MTDSNAAAVAAAATKKKRDEIDARREARKEENEKAREAQRLIDDEAIAEYEAQHPDALVKTLAPKQFVPGLPSVIAVVRPTGAQYKRYTDQVRRAGQSFEGRGKAQDLLGESCWVYPADDDVRKAMKEAFPGIVASAGVTAIRLAELDEEEEGKG